MQPVPTETRQERRLSVPSTLTPKTEDEFENRLRGLLKAVPNSVTLDCSGLEQVSSRHVNLLWQAHLMCDDAGVGMTLHQPSSGLIRVLRVLDLFHVFQLDDTCLSRQLREAVRPVLENASETYADEFSAAPSSVDQALASFITYVQRLRLPEMTAFELRTIFYEVAMNITGHGRNRDSESIVFSAMVDEQRIVMTFADSGAFFDPTTSAQGMDLRAAAHGRQRRGFGLEMIRRLTDRIEYVRLHGAINLLTLEKRWSRT